MPAHCQPQEHKLQVTVFKGTVQHYFNHSFVPEIKALNKIYDNFAVPMVKLKKKIHIVPLKVTIAAFLGKWLKGVIVGMSNFWLC